MTHYNVKNRAVHEGLITAVAVGGFFILIGIVALTPNFFDNVRAFFSDFTNIAFRIGDSNINLPAPAHPEQHYTLFTSVLYFIVGIAVLQAIILPLRLYFKSSIGRIAETVGNLVFWVGAAIVANIYLFAGTVNGWFQFWTTLIILAGISLIVRGMVQFSKRPIMFNA